MWCPPEHPNPFLQSRLPVSSQNHRLRSEEPLEVFWSNLPGQTGPPIASSPGPCPLSPQHVLVHSPQIQYFTLVFIELHEVPIRPFLQSVEVPLKSSTTLWSTKYSSQFCVTCRFSEDIFCPTIQVCNEDIGKYWPQYQHLEYTFRNGPSTKLFATDYNSLNLAFESVVNPLHCPLI